MLLVKFNFEVVQPLITTNNIQCKCVANEQAIFIKCSNSIDYNILLRGIHTATKNSILQVIAAEYDTQHFIMIE